MRRNQPETTCPLFAVRTWHSLNRPKRLLTRWASSLCCGAALFHVFLDGGICPFVVRLYGFHGPSFAPFTNFNRGVPRRDLTLNDDGRRLDVGKRLAVMSTIQPSTSSQTWLFSWSPPTYPKTRSILRAPCSRRKYASNKLAMSQHCSGKSRRYRRMKAEKSSFGQSSRASLKAAAFL